MAGNPFRALCLERLDLVLGGAVEFLARDVLIDLRRPLPVRTVRAAEVTDVGFANGAVFLAVPAEGAGTCVSAARGTIETAGCAVLAVTAAGPLAAFSEGPPVFSPAESAAVPLAITARTITKRLLITVTIRLTIAPAAERLTVTVTERLTIAPAAERLTVTVTERLPLTTAETAAVPLAITARTITKRLLITVTIRLTVAITERLPLTTAETAAVPLAITARTITKRLLITVTIRLPLTTAAERLTVTITERLTITVTKRLPLTTAGGTTG
ncbi:hypothetical protein LR392_13615 [Arthrobacter sp. AK04]|uniref:hypothetical protein n=1 Tax=Arthrobacter sp. AK04 TaxID=2900048 RepID=UPI001E2DFF06|nr:hypothetical protein [Arthrobacter sp. AK04]MCD5343261.1 hypothetical protein [Arthrobacter sp. AK04]